MTKIEVVTRIAAPAAVCFRVSLTLEVELEAMQQYGLRAVGGTTRGVIAAGEHVVWEVRQFGLRLRHTTAITGYEAPTYFQDSMVSGVFRSFAHDHFFREIEAGVTEMRDVMRFAMPWYLGGVVTEWMLVRRRMRLLLDARNEAVRRTAENPH